MTFCPSSTQSFSNTELNALYNGQGSVLPTSIPSSSDRIADQTRLLKPAFLTAHVQQLKTAKVIPATPSLSSTVNQDTALSQYTATLNGLVNNMRAEYCFYDARYKFAIRQFITGVANATSANAASGTLSALLDICERLNLRLNDFAQIANAITVEINNSTRSLNSEINSLNAEIASYSDKLRKQAEVLNSEAPTAEIRKRMVEYTREKAKATNNLLSLYFFLDIVALGMLFYVYKAA